MVLKQKIGNKNLNKIIKLFKNWKRKLSILFKCERGNHIWEYGFYPNNPHDSMRHYFRKCQRCGREECKRANFDTMPITYSWERNLQYNSVGERCFSHNNRREQNGRSSNKSKFGKR